MSGPPPAPSPPPCPPSPPPEAALHYPRHLKYWLRCLRTFLPSAYTPTDLSRLSLAFFILSALDLLSALETHTTPAEREDYINWIYNLQLPDGGFRGSPATMESGEQWDVANAAAGYFALGALAVLGDDFSRVRRGPFVGSLVARLQREEGGFGEWLLKGEDGDTIMGADDMRYAYFPAVVRWMLRGPPGEKGGYDDVVVPGAEEGGKENEKEWTDIDVDKCVEFIENSLTYDHGFAQAPHLESHAGLTYCALASLSLLNRLSTVLPPNSPKRNGVIKWLVFRQSSAPLSPDCDPETDPEFPPPSGFSGRANKLPDTCYSFWVGASLALLGEDDLISKEGNRRWLLEKTQHVVGGFGKFPESLPDVLHSYLGLAALGVMGETGVKRVDPALCLSMDARARLEGLVWFRRA